MLDTVAPGLGYEVEYYIACFFAYYKVVSRLRCSSPLLLTCILIFGRHTQTWCGGSAIVPFWYYQKRNGRQLNPDTHSDEVQLNIVLKLNVNVAKYEQVHQTSYLGV